MTKEEIESRAVAALQGDMNPAPDFWGDAARAAGLPRAEFMATVARLLETGKLKRVGAVVRHGAAGFGHNAMLAMRVPADRVDEAGEALSAFGFVSHCYERAVPPGFPFNLFAMIHARSAAELDGFVEAAVSAAKPESFAALKTVREAKKESMKFVCCNAAAPPEKEM